MIIENIFKKLFQNYQLNILNLMSFIKAYLTVNIKKGDNYVIKSNTLEINLQKVINNSISDFHET